jgi:AcrR family transcriptional regulator
VTTSVDEEVIAALDTPGVRRALQARSRALVGRLVNEALAMLQDVDFDALSIEALCERADATVGSFYSRFESKEAFVNALQRAVVEQTRLGIVHDYENGVAPEGSLAHLLGWISKSAFFWYARNEGFVRASLRRAGETPDSWTPLRELGRLQLACAEPRILRFLDASARAGAQDRIQIAFQMLFGALNNMVLINPGPFTIRSPEAPRLIARAMLSFIDAAPAQRTA